MNNDYSISVFLERMAELNQALSEGENISNLFTQIVQAICIFIGCNQDKHEIRMLLTLIQKLAPMEDSDSSEPSFANEFLVKLVSLERFLRGSGDPMDILKSVLRCALEFYDGDSITVIETDLTNMTGEIILDEANDGGYRQFTQDKPTLKYSIDRCPTLYTAISNNETSNIDTASGLLTTSELQDLKAINTTFAAIAPFHKRKSGYIILRNPHKWTGYNEFLQMISYVVVSEMNELTMFNDLALADNRNPVLSEHDVYIECLGPLRIKTAHEDCFCPKTNNIPMRILIYMVMYRRRTVSQEELIEAIWGDTTKLTGAANNFRISLKRARENMNQVYPYDFIVYDQNGRLRISPDAKLHLDTELFEAYYQKGSQSGIPLADKVDYLMKAYQLYRGDFLDGHPIDDEWVRDRRTHYDIRFTNLLMNLAPALYNLEMYPELFDISVRGLKCEPHSSIFHYYQLQSLIGQGFIDKAKKHLALCRDYLIKDDRHAIELLLKNM